MNAAAPYAHAGSSTQSIMLQVCLALTPTTAAGFYVFGWPAFYLWLVTCVAALACEALALWLRYGHCRRLADGSALLTGWLIALTLPPWAPWWIGVFGAAFALLVGKHIYGGLGANLFNPAMLARVALLVTFPLQMTAWTVPGAGVLPDALASLAITFGGAPGPDGFAGATPLGHLQTGLTQHLDARELLVDFQLGKALLGWQPGSMGETSELLVLMGGLWLLWRRIISWEIPLALLSTLALLALIGWLVDPTTQGHPLFHLASGGVMLGALFIATDPVTSPVSRLGRLVFGAGCGALIFVIRAWGTFPEAVGFAVLFMNAMAPLIDRYCRPRIYGRRASGEPLPALTTRELLKEVQR